jgi:murein L,D-transpeptidase YcbB/YkuD
MVDRKATANVKLEDQVRVHLAYLTAWPDDSGKIQYFSDAYGRDASLVQALRLTEAQFGRSKPAQLVQNAGKPAVPAID